MLPWAALLGTLGLNLRQHLRGKPTLCSTGRRFIPAAAFLTGWAALTAWICPHYCRPLWRRTTDTEDPGCPDSTT